LNDFQKSKMPSADAQRSPWVAFIGFKFQYVGARPGDAYVHLGAGRAFRRHTLCDKRARRLWWGSGRVCPDCHRLAPPMSEELRDESLSVRGEADRALEFGDTAKAEHLRQVADVLEWRADGLDR
jgi:hypothetical protein